MPCQGCRSSTPGKTRCVVCDAKWCDSCLYSNAEKRSSGWKCNGCVGTTSKKTSSDDYWTRTKEEFIVKHGLQFHSESERNRILREEGFRVD
jgi:hypothetical protein